MSFGAAFNIETEYNIKTLKVSRLGRQMDSSEHNPSPPYP